MVVLAPIGFWYCFMEQITDGKIFAALYGVLAVYFSGVMVRLMLVFAPSVCVLTGIGLSHVINKFSKQIINDLKEPPKQLSAKKRTEKKAVHWSISLVMLMVLSYMISQYIFHCTYAGAEAYSSPSIVMASRD